MRFRLFFLATFLIAVTAAAEPPARIIRLNLTDGAVSFRPAGIDEWTDATVNRPIIDGDELWTEDRARVEMHIGASAVRLGGSTSFGIVSANDQVAQFRLSAGTMNVHVRALGDDDVWEIDTPNASVSLLREGRYRIDVSRDGLTTTVTTRGGEAEVTAGGNAFAVRSGEQAEINGDNDITHDIFDAPHADAFDRWCGDRDLREERVASLQYLPRDVVGYEDLDANGRWRFVADYGWVWSPTVVVAGWAPYRFGHWAWVEPWGWTWIDDAPWGFAPFHYGRWAYADGGWFWVPGRIEHPVYAPALVVFGGGGNWRVGVSVGAVAWWPLAPGEVYVPAYRVSHDYIRNINAPFVRGNIDVDVTRVRYRNQTVAGGVTAVTRAAFVSAKPVGGARLSVAVNEAIQAKTIGSAAPVAPAPSSVIGQRRGLAVAPVPPQAIVSRPVIAKTTPPEPPISFRAKQEVLSQNPGQPLPQTNTVAPRRTIVQPVTPQTDTPKPRTFRPTVMPPSTPTPTTTTPTTSTSTFTPRFRPATTTSTTTTSTTTTSAPTSTQPPRRMSGKTTTSDNPPPPPPSRKSSDKDKDKDKDTKKHPEKDKEKKDQ